MGFAPTRERGALVPESFAVNIRLPEPASPQVIFAAMAYAIALENHCGRPWQPKPYQTPGVLMFGQTSCYAAAAIRVSPPYIGYFEPNQKYSIIEIATTKWVKLPCTCTNPHKRVKREVVFKSFIAKITAALEIIGRV